MFRSQPPKWKIEVEKELWQQQPQHNDYSMSLLAGTRLWMLPICRQTYHKWGLPAYDAIFGSTYITFMLQNSVFC